MIPFVQNTRKCKLVPRDRKKEDSLGMGVGMGSDKERKGTLEVTDSSLIILTGGDGLTVACMCQNVSDRTLYTCAFYCTSIRSQ